MSDKEKKEQDTGSEQNEGSDNDGNKPDNESSAGKQENSGDRNSSDDQQETSGKDTSSDDDGDEDNGDEDSGEDEDDVIKVARTPTSPALLSQLQHSRQYSQARGLGAGGTGAATFRVQRLTALALIPLVIWFAVSVVRLSTGTHAQAAAWLAWPVNAAIMALFIVIALRHAVIGLQIIFEDYVHGEGLRATCVLAVKAIALVLGVSAVAALIHLAL